MTAVMIGCDAGEQSEGDTRERDVTEPVAEQGESALHEEGADRRCGEPGEHGRDQRAGA